MLLALLACLVSYWTDEDVVLSARRFFLTENKARTWLHVLTFKLSRSNCELIQGKSYSTEMSLKSRITVRSLAQNVADETYITMNF